METIDELKKRIGLYEWNKSKGFIVGSDDSVRSHIMLKGDIESDASTSEIIAGLERRRIAKITKGEKTSLHEAVWAGDQCKVELLLNDSNSDINIDTQDNKGLTPLHYVALRGKTDEAKMLLEKGADVNKRTNQGWTPLYATSFACYKDTAELLISKGANINRKHTEDIGLLFLAVEREVYKSAEEIVKSMQFLIDLGVSVNDKDNFGQIPLEIAILVSPIEVVKFLLDKEIDVNLKNPYTGLTPLDNAIIHKRIEVVKLLLDKGFKITKFTEETVCSREYKLEQKIMAERIRLLIKERRKHTAKRWWFF